METNIDPAPQRGAFADRHDAGRRLARALEPYRDQHPVVLALPRGGVPVGFEIAKALEAPLDVLLVRKLRAPGFLEFGLGAVVDGPRPQRILNQAVIDSLHVSADYIESEARVQLKIIEEYRRRYRGEREPVPLAQRTVILADDGVVTGATVRAGLQALALAAASRTILAVPVAPRDSAQALTGDADDMVCLLTPEDFQSVAFYYADFNQVTDDDVVELLRKAVTPIGGAVPGRGIRWEA